MRIQNLKVAHETIAAPDAPGSVVNNTSGAVVRAQAERTQPVGDAAAQIERQAMEIVFLRARIQHLDLVLETARSLMGSNHERLLRRLHELPRELVELSTQLRRIDPLATW